MGDEARSDRIHRNVSRRGVRWASSITTEAKRLRGKVAAPPAAGIYEMGVAPVSFPDGEPEPPFIGRDDDEMDVIGRQTVGPDLDASFQGLRGLQRARKPPRS
jgi:hypothetical protein